jgi:hypothetical protein
MLSVEVKRDLMATALVLLFTSHFDLLKIVTFKFCSRIGWRFEEFLRDGTIRAAGIRESKHGFAFDCVAFNGNFHAVSRLPQICREGFENQRAQENVTVIDFLNNSNFLESESHVLKLDTILCFGVVDFLWSALMMRRVTAVVAGNVKPKKSF